MRFFQLRLVTVAALVAFALNCDGDGPPPASPTSSTTSALSYPPNAVLPLEGQAGSIAGSGSVAPDGSYHYSIALQVPPGRRGMAPQLSIDYSSRADNGLLGMGWSLGGMAKIQRCPRTIRHDGKTAGVEFSLEDDLCFGGAHLMKVNYAEYRLETDNSRRFTMSTDLKTITMWKPDGSTWQFSSSPGGSAFTLGEWLLTRQQDADGNQVNYDYEVDSDAEYYPQAITYTDRDGEVGKREVTFSYREGLRVDRIERFTGGRAFRINRLLSAIILHAPNPTIQAAVGEYDLIYDQSPDTLRARLVKVDHYGADFNRTESKVFGYNSTSFQGYDNAVNHLTVFPTTVSAGAGAVVRAFDLDADGRDELLAQQGVGDIAIAYSKADMAPGSSSRLLATNISLKDSVVGDLDGDDRPELLTPLFTAPEQDDPLAHYHLFRWTGGAATGSFLDAGDWGPYHFNDIDGYTVTTPGAVNLYALADLDGDGLPELVRGTHFEPRDNDTVPPHNEDGLQANEPYYPAFFSYRWYLMHNASNPGHLAFGPATELWPANGTNIGVYSPLAGGTHPFYTLAEGGGRQALVFANHWDSLFTEFHEPCLKDPYTAIRQDPSSEAVVTFADSQAGPNSVYADVNGDGESDLVHYNAQTKQICVTFGGAPGSTAQQCSPVPASSGFSTVETVSCSDPTTHVNQIVGPWHLIAYDMDDDGRDDIALIHDGTATTVPGEAYRVWLNAAHVLGVTTLPLGLVGVGDFDGDGRKDAVFDWGLYASYLSIARAPNITRDWLVSVGDATATATNVHERVGYLNHPGPVTTTWPATFWAGASLTTPAIAPSCAFPQHCMRTGFEVVHLHEVHTTDDAQAWLQEWYAYGDPRFDSHGGGFLGFGAVDKWEQQRGRETVSEYTTTGNLMHVIPLRTTTMTPLANSVLPPPTSTQVGPHLPYYTWGTTARVRVDQTSYAYDQCGGSDASGAEPICLAVARTDEYEENLSLAPPNSGFTMPWVYAPNGRPTLYDAGVQQLASHVVTYTHDHWGNVTNELDYTNGGVSKTTITTYVPPDTAHWRMALPSSVTVAVGCADAQCVSTSAGTLTPTPRRIDFEYIGPDLHYIFIEPTSSNPSLQETVQFYRNGDGSVLSVTRTTPGQPARSDSWDLDAQERMFVVDHGNALNQIEYFLYHPAYGSLVSYRDRSGLITNYQIDELGAARSISTPGHATMTMSYLPRTNGSALSGTVTKLATSDGTLRTVETDLAGHTVISSHVGFSGISIVSSSSYDAEGRMITATRPGWGTGAAAAESTLYDTLDRPFTHTDAAGNTTSYIQSYFTTTVLDPSNHLTQLTRDVDGRIVASMEQGPNGALTTQYRYGDFNQLEGVIDPKGNTTTTTWDERGRRRSVTAPDSATMTTTFDGWGEELAVARGTATTTYVYDQLGRPVTATNADGIARWSWDPNAAIGELFSSTAPDGTTHTILYDAYERPVFDQFSSNGQTALLTSTYDASGRPISLNYPKIPGTSVGLSIGYTYNTHGYLSKIARTDSGSTTAYWQAQSETVDDVPDSVVFGNGVIGTRTFDAAGRVTEIKDAAMTDLKYTYNADNEIASLVDVPSARTDYYYYDSLHRLTRWSALPIHATSRIMNYTYDDLGNLLLAQLGSTTTAAYTYGDPTRPHAATNASDVGSLSYDLRGRLVTTPAREITYTERDLPKTVQTVGGTTSFRYDVAGKRVFEQTPVGWTFSLDGLFERRLEDGVIKDYYYVHGPEGIVAQAILNESTQARGLYFMHLDDHRTTVAVSTGSGALNRRFYFDPWGHRTDANAVPTTGTDAAFLFGRDELRYDDDLGLVNQRGRTYDPTLRRFTSPDPFVSRPFEGQSYNRYAYLSNDPVNHRDPNGFEDDPIPTCFICDPPVPPPPTPTSTDGSGVSNYQPRFGGGGAEPPPVPIQIDQRPSSTPAPSVGASTSAPMIRGTATVNPVPVIVVRDANGHIHLMPEASLMEQAILGTKDVLTNLVERRAALGSGVRAAAGGARVVSEAVLAKDIEEVAAIRSGIGRALEGRADQIHSVLDPIAAEMRTSSVLRGTANNGSVLDLYGAGATADLTSAQLALQKAGEEAVMLPGFHAEMTVMAGETALVDLGRGGLSPVAIAASQKFCPICLARIKATGAVINPGGRSAYWLPGTSQGVFDATVRQLLGLE